MKTTIEEWKLKWIVSWSYDLEKEGVSGKYKHNFSDRWRVFESLEEARKCYKQAVYGDLKFLKEEGIPKEFGDCTVASISAIVDSTDFDRCTKNQYEQAVDTFRND